MLNYSFLSAKGQNGKLERSFVKNQKLSENISAHMQYSIFPLPHPQINLMLFFYGGSCEDYQCWWKMMVGKEVASRTEVKRPFSPSRCHTQIWPLSFRPGIHHYVTSLHFWVSQELHRCHIQQWGHPLHFLPCSLAHQITHQKPGHHPWFHLPHTILTPSAIILLNVK